MCKEFVNDYEFVKVNEHKSHLLMNCNDLEKLGAEMESPFATKWDKKSNCKDTVYSIELVSLIWMEFLQELCQNHLDPSYAICGKGGVSIVYDL